MLLDKKRGLLVLSSLFLALLIPIVSAQYEGVYSMFSFLFGTGEGAFIFLKAAVWIILFAIIFWAAKKMFSGSKGIATIFSIVVSLISIRFIPDEYIYYIGSAYGVFGIVVLVLAIIGGTLLILNSYFPIKQHKAFGVVWALFYFFIAWIFHQITGIITGIFQVDELLPVIGPWGKWVCIVLGIACLLRAFSGTSSYARTTQPQYQPDNQGGGGGNQGGGPQQPIDVRGGQGGQGGSATANANAAALAIAKGGGGGGNKRGAASFDLYIDGSTYYNKDNLQHTTDLRNVDKTNFLIKNGGTGGTLYWRAAASKGLKVEPNVGKLKKGQPVRVNVSVINRNIGSAFVPHVTVIAKRGTTGDARTLVRLRVAKAFIRYRLN